MVAIGDQIIDGIESRGVVMSAGGDLHRGGLAREGKEAVSFRMAVEIDEDVDMVPPDTIGLSRVIHACGVAPLVDNGLAARGQKIRRAGGRVTKDLESAAVMMSKHGGEEPSDGVRPQIRRYIADPQSPVRRTIVVMGSDVRCQRLGVHRIPAARLGEDRIGIEGGTIVHTEEQVGVGVRVAWVMFECLSVGVHGLIRLALCRQGIAQVGVTFGEIGLELDRPPTGGDGFLRLACVLKQGCQVDVGSGVIGFQFQRPLIVMRGFLQHPPRPERVAKVVMRLGKPRAQSDRTLEGGDRPIDLALIRERDSQVVIDLGVIGQAGQGLAVGSGGLIQVPGRAQGQPQIVARLGIIGLACQRAFNQLYRLAVPPCLKCHDPEPMQRIGVGGLTGEELAVGRLGVLEAAGFMVFEGLF